MALWWREIELTFQYRINMNKESLLKEIATKGYVISYAANLNFATYDIVTGLPPKVTFLSLAISIIGLVCSEISTYWITVPILLMSIACIYTERYAKDINKYGERGRENTHQWNKLKELYLKVKNCNEGTDFLEEFKELNAISDDFNRKSEYDQIFFAKCFANYKLFCEKDYHWMDEQLHFTFWKDKFPSSLKAFLFFVLMFATVMFCVKCQCIADFFKGLFDFCNAK